jgi:anti-sigma regulatory factor (Ser/Thr protein kinase)
MMTADQAGVSAAQTSPERETACRVRQVALPTDGQAAGIARRVTRDALSSWQLKHLADSAALVVSELVANALQHAHADPPELRLQSAGNWLRVEVHDGDHHPAKVRATAALKETGRGLVLVEAIARRWGVRKTEVGKAVWAELD